MSNKYKVENRVELVSNEGEKFTKALVVKWSEGKWVYENDGTVEGHGLTEQELIDALAEDNSKGVLYHVGLFTIVALIFNAMKCDICIFVWTLIVIIMYLSS